LLKYKDIPTSIITDFMKSAAYAYTGIVLFNNFVERDGKIKLIEFFADGGSSGFRLNVNM
jgi:hypothetical protein